MKIGEVIRKYRKEKQMTQEEMAGHLGVTAPAVNKWENGNSYPDISLLAPIARLLGITTDALLSYQEELTEQEVDELIQTLGNQAKVDYESAFAWAEKKIQEYPNCERLILQAAQVLDSFRMMLGVDEPERFDEKLYGWYLRSVESSNYDIAQTAAVALFQYSLSKENYDKAQEYLDRLPKQQWNRKQFQAVLFMRQGKKEEASKLYEELMFFGYGNISWGLNGLHILAVQDNQLERAQMLVDKQKNLARLMEMGRYMEAAPGLELALHKKDKEKTLEILMEMLDSIKEMDSYRNSPLYTHMTFSDHSSTNIIFMLQRAFENDEEIEFLKGDPRFEKLMENLESLGQ
ncbi:MAG: helix-turn-helix domain-containing protein [Blautia sp.]